MLPGVGRLIRAQLTDVCAVVHTLPVLTLLLACGAPGERLVVAGSSTVHPVVEVAAQAYEAAHPGVEIDVQGGGSSVGISSARSGLADLGMVSRALKPDEADLVATPVALDGIALVVHASNPVTDLTTADVVAIFSGERAEWAPGRPVTVVNKEEGRATLELFEAHFGLKGRFTPSAVIVGPNGQAIATVAGNPDAITYVSIGSAMVAEADGTPIRRVSLDGEAATPDAVASGSYPLARPLVLVTEGPPTGLAAEFVAYLLSPEGQAIARAQDFVPVPSVGIR